MANVTFKDNPITLTGKEVKVGETAPDFTVLDNKLNEVSLSDYEGKVKLISVVPSVDTGVCSEQTRRFNEEAEKYPNVKVITLSMDLPFAQRRWAHENDISHIDIYSDHKNADFGEKYGVLMEELRLLARSVFILDQNNKVTYAEYVSEGTNHPDYQAALQHLQQYK